MDRLWAPWRMSYVSTGLATKKIDDFIAHHDAEDNDRENLVVTRTPLTVVLLNRFPYSNGHLLIAPRRVVADIGDLTDDETLDCQHTIIKMIQAMRTFMRPDGFNVGLNLGKAAGAGLPEHLHWHVVPRWNGDVNFMTTVADNRVIVQALDEFWLQLRRALGLDAA